MQIVDMALDDRMKMYEKAQGSYLMPLLPVIARIDGIGFSKFTKNMERPFDERLHIAMVETTKKLIEEFGANCAYTQSDEISLGWYLDYKSEIYGGGRVQKLNSHLASKATLFFVNEASAIFGENPIEANNWFDYCDKYNGFDARVWNVPNLNEAGNAFLWREQDATRNSVSQAARAYFSHNECNNKNSSELQDMLHSKGINWNNYPDWFKRGTYIIKRMEVRPFTAEEIDSLPEKHEARRNPNLSINRTKWSVEYPKLSAILNKGEFLFREANPCCNREDNDG